MVFNSEFDPDDDKLKGMSRDPISGNFFVFSDYAVYKFRVDREKRNVWRIYLERGEFDLAQQFCRDDPDKLDEVFTRRAQDLFEKGCHVESAMHFAKTKCSFEEIALKFMQVIPSTWTRLARTAYFITSNFLCSGGREVCVAQLLEEATGVGEPDD